MANVGYTAPLFPQYEIGEHTYGTPVILGGGPGATLVIGRYCSIADGAKLELVGDHNADRMANYPFENIDVWSTGRPLELYHRPIEIVIGNDVWLGSECLVLHGFTIGDGAAVGAGAVVARDVRPYAVVGGNPARELYRRFDDEDIEELLRIRWWDWPDEKVRENLDWLNGKRVRR